MPRPRLGGAEVATAAACRRGAACLVAIALLPPLVAGRWILFPFSGQRGVPTTPAVAAAAAPLPSISQQPAASASSPVWRSPSVAAMPSPQPPRAVGKAAGAVGVGGPLPADEQLPDAPVMRGSRRAALWKDVTSAVGLPTYDQVKYGGALIADIDGDGWYDLVLNHHDKENLQLFWNNKGRNFAHGSDPLPYRIDAHGLAAGDLGGSLGAADFIVAQGGSNGNQPVPPQLLRTRGSGRKLRENRAAAGLGPAAGGRGRTPLLVDLDGDGDLDLILLNYELSSGDPGPRQKVYENTGGGHFKKRFGTGLESQAVERGILVDLNGDGRLDIVAFPFLRILIASGNFRFVDKTIQWLSRVPNWTSFRFAVRAAAEIDTTNSGRPDIYLCRHPWGDVLLLNRKGVHFVLAPAGALPDGQSSGDVTVGDFTNDGHLDLFTSHAAGTTNGRPAWRPDTLLTAVGDGTFSRSNDHGAVQWTVAPGHSVQALDYNLDGKLDLLVGGGDEVTSWRNITGVPGRWSLFANTVSEVGSWITLVVGRSPSGRAAASGATLRVRAGGGGVRRVTYHRRVGGSGGGCTTDELRLVHVGLGSRDWVEEVNVKWTNGERYRRRGLAVDQVVTLT
ncbi:hypothetical protein MMPV_008181 [Pyropia vietnamensis]